MKGPHVLRAARFPSIRFRSREVTGKQLSAGSYALSVAGDRFRGPQLVAANAAVVMCYGFGSLAGPVLGGVAMTFVGPHGLMWLVALAVLVFLPATFLRGRQSDAG